MWKCKKCNHKNSNSSEKCHGKNCNGIREIVAFELPIQLVRAITRKRVYDFCPVHGKDVIWTETKYHGKKTWRCQFGGHRPAILIGKSKPFPLELMTKEERERYDSKLKKKVMTVPDADTGDGAN